MHSTPSSGDILAAFSHEIRTPLAVVRGAIDLLDNDDGGPGLTDDQRGFVELALRNVRRAESLVASIIESGRVDGGQWPVDPIPAQAGRLVRSAIDEVRDSVASAPRIELTEDARIPLVPADPNGIRRIVRNLVANAVKVTPHGESVRVHVYLQGGELRIDVSDCGPGVEEDRREWIFGRFHRGGGHGGIGLGLYLARAIAIAHGGSLKCVAPTEGTGACFRLILPLRRQTVQSGRPSGQRWLAVRPRDGAQLTPVQTFRITEALRGLAPAARRLEFRSRVDALLPNGCEEDQEGLCDRLRSTLGEAFTITQHLGHNEAMSA